MSSEISLSPINPLSLVYTVFVYTIRPASAASFSRRSYSSFFLFLSSSSFSLFFFSASALSSSRFRSASASLSAIIDAARAWARSGSLSMISSPIPRSMRAWRLSPPPRLSKEPSWWLPSLPLSLSSSFSLDYESILCILLLLWSSSSPPFFFSSSLTSLTSSPLESA